MAADIIFETRGRVGRITLNRPAALNAIDFDMSRSLLEALNAWAGNSAIAAVVIGATGDRAFCAGGDIRALYRARRAGDFNLPRKFYRLEYRLNRLIHRFPKPYIALIDGIVMGGGVGISVHGSHRVVTERALFAMPETGIGMFPDIGASYFLPRLPGWLGLYLGLSGARLGPADMLYCGLATHFVPAEKLPALEAALADTGWSNERGMIVDSVLERFAARPYPAPLADIAERIDRCFSGESVEAILESLDRDGGDWARATLGALRGKSPTSLKVAFRLLREGKPLDLESCLALEYRLSQRFMASHDFYEGVRALLIDKDLAPKWRPASLGEVTEADIAAYFAPLPEGDLVFPDHSE